MAAESNYILVLYTPYADGTPELVGHKTITKELFSQLINDMFKSFEAESSTWTIEKRYHYKWETSIMTTFFVIIEAIKQPV